MPTHRPSPDALSQRVPSQTTEPRGSHKTGGSIVARIIGILVGFLLALGLAWGAYSLAVEAFSRESGQATPWGIIIAIVLLGLLSLSVAIVTAYAPASPLVVLETDSERVVQGQVVRVRYHIRGKPRLVYGAQLFLRCDDVDDSTEDSPPVRKTLYERVVHEIVGATLLEEECCTLTIPKNLPATLKAPPTEIQWELGLRLTLAVPHGAFEALALKVVPEPFALEAMQSIEVDAGSDQPPPLHVTLGAAAPNELRGIVSWSLKEPLTSVDLRLFWYTKRGSELKMVPVEECRIEASSPVGNAPFSFTWSDQPRPYKSLELEIGWALEATAQPSGTLHRTRLALVEPNAGSPNERD